MRARVEKVDILGCTKSLAWTHTDIYPYLVENITISTEDQPNIMDIVSSVP